MNKVILKAISLALLSTALANCDGSDKQPDSSQGTFTQSAKNVQPDVNSKQAPPAPGKATPLPVVSTAQNNSDNQSASPAAPDQLAASFCNAPDLDDATAVSAALKGPSIAAKFPSLLPVPLYGENAGGDAFQLASSTIIQTQGNDEKLVLAANYLQAILKASTGYALPIDPAVSSNVPCVKLEIRELKDGDATVAPEGYSLKSTRNGVVIRSSSAGGLFNGVQTLLQLLPPNVYSKTVQPVTWTAPAVAVVDWPRFAYRGAMLDVARTFFSVDEVKSFIDKLALLKVNILHLHLTDDQGWRIAIDELPELTNIGGISQIYSSSSSDHKWYYTRDQYKDIVAYAGSRFITIVPEIEGPGHATAARASIPELTCDGDTPPEAPTTDDGVGTPTICLDDEAHVAAAAAYLKTVVASIAALTPGPYIHIGSDETSASPEEMTAYTAAAYISAKAANKTLMGWNELATGDIPAGTVLQYWKNYTTDVAKDALKNGAKFVMSPAATAYLDQGYPDRTPRGNNGPSNWAGTKDTKKVYDWDPATFLQDGDTPFLTEKDVLGVEGTYWSEYTTADHTGYLDYMVFPRLASLAEIGWSPSASHSWDSFKVRLGDQGARWEAFGVGYKKTSEITWKTLSDVVILD